MFSSLPIVQDVDMGIGLFSVTALRAEVVDFTYPVTFESSKIVGSRGIPEVDPWGFLLPLSPLVWATLFISLLGLLSTLELFHFCSPVKTTSQRRRRNHLSSCVRVLLQQGGVIKFNPLLVDNFPACSLKFKTNRSLTTK